MGAVTVSVGESVGRYTSASTATGMAHAAVVVAACPGSSCSSLSPCTLEDDPDRSALVSVCVLFSSIASGNK